MDVNIKIGQKLEELYNFALELRALDEIKLSLFEDIFNQTCKLLEEQQGLEPFNLSRFVSIFNDVGSIRQQINEPNFKPHKILKKIYEKVIEFKEYFSTLVAENTNQELPKTEDEFLLDEDIIKDYLAEMADYLDNLEESILYLSNNLKDKEVIHKIFRLFHSIKGNSGIMSHFAINKLAHKTEDLLNLAREGNLDVNDKIVDLMLKAYDIIKTIFSGFSLHHTEELAPQPQYDAVMDTIDVVLSESELSKLNGETFTDIEVEDDGVDIFNQPQEQEKRIVSFTETSDTLRIKSEKLNYLVDIVSEIVISLNNVRVDSYVTNSTNIEFIKKFGHLTQVITELQRASMTLRMVPLGTVFQKMKRVMHDVVTGSDKQVELAVKGETTEVDRNLVNQLYDPLVHMIRNACDHGIEPPTERLKKGKKAFGTITLNSYHKGDNVVIEVQDDGRGLNKDMLLEKAKTKGLLATNRELSERELYNLILQPGFSTAETVTDISGRGVGMDVVNQSIIAMNGRLEIFSEEHNGTLFRMFFPLTLAIITGMLVKCGNQNFVIPVAAIKRLIQPKKSHINKPAGGGETYKMSDKVLPILHLENIFDIKTDTALEDGLLIIVANAYKEFALKVDALIGIQDIVVKSLSKHMRKIKEVSGSTILGDGSVCLILDVSKFNEK